MLNDTLTVVLADSEGEGLQPLTSDRTKSAIPFGGKYRLIDFCLTNCLHSGLRRILVMTKYQSHSLHKHLRDGWSVFNPELGEYITAVPPQVRAEGGWDSSVAHSIHQNINLLERSSAKWVLVLQGDDVYRMDYEPLIQAHADSGADVTLVTCESSFDNSRQVRDVEYDDTFNIMGLSEYFVTTPVDGDENRVVNASMGIYVFSADVLKREVADAVAKNDVGASDFERTVIETIIKNGKAFAYPFGHSVGRVTQDKYWRNINSIDEYYMANMELLNPTPSIDLYQKNWPVRTYSGQYPPARNAPGVLGHEGISINSIASTGSVICGGKVQGSILFNDVYVGEEAIIESSLLLEGVSVGDGALLRNCIIDEGVTIPEGEMVGHDERVDKERFMLTDGGLVVIPKGFVF